MSDSPASNKTQNDALRARLEAWINQKNQVLLEEVIATWQQALTRFQPDEVFLSQLRDTAPPPAASAPSDVQERDLASALDHIEAATSQSDLLRRLMNTISPLVERSALFILKQGLVSLYTHRGFPGDAPTKAGAVVPPDELETLIHGSVHAIRHKGPAYATLIGCVSSFEASECAIFPLRHRSKAVGLVLVDSGLRQKLDHPEMTRSLVLAASAVLAGMAGAKDGEGHSHPPEARPSAPTQRLQDPIETASPALDSKVRTAAERLARVLVGDVELYFPAKVAQARTQGNLYGLLRDELDRSRATFVERFGEEVEVKYRIFTTTTIQLLCDGDASKLGKAPWA